MKPDTFQKLDCMLRWRLQLLYKNVHHLQKHGIAPKTRVLDTFWNKLWNLATYQEGRECTGEPNKKKECLDTSHTLQISKKDLKSPQTIQQPTDTSKKLDCMLRCRFQFLEENVHHLHPIDQMIVIRAPKLSGSKITSREENYYQGANFKLLAIFW